jgi:phosphoribosylformylglycinamidine synthase
LLGALDAQLGLSCGAIGGKDSMSGSFEGLDVPPTLVSFAVSVNDAKNLASPEFKGQGSKVYFVHPGFGNFEKPDFAALSELFDNIEKLIGNGKVKSAWAISGGGTAEAVVKMCMGNRIGFTAVKELTAEPLYGGFVIEADELLPGYEKCLLGTTTKDYCLTLSSGEVIDMQSLQTAWEETLEKVYPSLAPQSGKAEAFDYSRTDTKVSCANSGVGSTVSCVKAGTDSAVSCVKAGTESTVSCVKAGTDSAVSCARAKTDPLVTNINSAKPKFIIPVFPGTNSEYETAKAIRKAGGEAEVIIIRNRCVSDIASSVRAFEQAIRLAHGIVIPGGFSGGDEPDGAAKYIASFFRNPAIADAVADLLQARDGLICGIGNGFQALIKLGLLPYGEIREPEPGSPVLLRNTIGRHQSVMARVRVSSNKSPWLSRYEIGSTAIVPASFSEGRFTAGENEIRALAANGQIATQYVDLNGMPTQDTRFNPSGSDFAIEGITSPDGRVFGRMCSSERGGEGLFINIPGQKAMDIFAGAVGYYTGYTHERK